MNIESHWTRKQTAEYFSSLGIEGAAAEALLKETAAIRHADRVQRTLTAAAAECSRELESGHDPEHCTECLVLLLSDRIGIGGTQGCSGDSTARHPAFENLGAGRKQAGDGGAWMAALDAAIWQATRTTDFSDIDIGPGDVWIAVGDEPLWARSVAREGLRRAVGLAPWHELVGIALTGPAGEWSEILNRAEAALAAEKS